MFLANLKKISLMENMAALEALQDSSCELGSMTIHVLSALL